MSDKRIRVRVQASQTVRYNQILSFSPDEWDEFKRQGERDACDDITERLDLRAVYDADPVERFLAFAVDESDKPVVPEDSTEGES